MNRSHTTDVLELRPTTDEAEPKAAVRTTSRIARSSLVRRSVAMLVALLTLAGLLTIAPVSPASAATAP